MPEVRTQLESGCRPENGAKVRLLTIDSLDGRTLAVKRIKALETQIKADMGGDLTGMQKSLMRRAAVLSAVLEDQEGHWADGTPLTLNEYCSATNVLRRLLATLGLDRKQKPLSGAPVLLGEG